MHSWGREEAKGQRRISTFKFFLSPHKYEFYFTQERSDWTWEGDGMGGVLGNKRQGYCETEDGMTEGWFHPRRYCTDNRI